MKAILSKTALIVLGILLVSTIALDGYMSIMFLKLGDASLFDTLEIVSQYDLFEKIYLGAYLVFTNMVLLASGLGVILYTFLRKK